MAQRLTARQNGGGGELCRQARNATIGLTRLARPAGNQIADAEFDLTSRQRCRAADLAFVEFAAFPYIEYGMRNIR